jgi:hypothetical protein
VIWKLEYQEPLEGKLIEMCSIHWMQEHEEYQYENKMSVAHKQDWYCICNCVSEEHSASILM